MSALTAPPRNGNLPRALRCSARTWRGTSCKGLATMNGRCRMHGGRPAPPKTFMARNVVAQTNTRHGHYGEYGRMLRAIVRDLAARARALQPETIGG